MLKNTWTKVSESAPFAKVEPGGYIGKIIDVEDVPDRQYLKIIYDIVEGEFAGHYDDDWGRANPWAHSFIRSYKPSATGMFKAFLERLQDSNPDFDIEVWERACDERDFIGLEIGLVLQFEDYTNRSGEDKERLQVVGVYSTDYIREGKFKLPARSDKREKRGEHASATDELASSLKGYGITFTPTDDNDDLPFA